MLIFNIKFNNFKLFYKKVYTNNESVEIDLKLIINLLIIKYYEINSIVALKYFVI